MTKRAFRAITALLLTSVVLISYPVGPAWASSYTISVYAGTSGVWGNSGDGGAATSASMQGPQALATDSVGNIYIADQNASVVRRVAPTGIITTVAGNGTSGYTGDGGPATSAELASPEGLAVDSSGDLFIADGSSNVVRKVAPNGTITTFAGNGTGGYSGDNGPATLAAIWGPADLTVDSSGNLFIASRWNAAIRKVNTSGIITTIAGGNGGGYTGDGGPATAAQIDAPRGVALDAVGNLYIADANNNVVRKVATNGTISTVAGNHSAGNTGDGGPATSAALNDPTRLAVDAAGTLYISSTDANVVRTVNMTSGIIRTVAGTGTSGSAGINGPANQAQLNTPMGLLVTSADDLYIADFGDWTVRLVHLGGTSSTTASVTVDPSFTFAVSGVVSSTCNGISSTLNTSAMTNAVNFGHIAAGARVFGAQNLQVSDNAGGGYVVYLRSTATTLNVLKGSGTHVIADAGAVTLPASGNEFFGYSTDATGSGIASGNIASVPRSPAGAATVSAGSAGTSINNCVIYALGISATTPADTYSTTVIYTAIPTF